MTDEKGKSETRIVLRFHPRMAPIKVGVFPLLKNKPELVAKAREVQALLRPHMNVFYDEGGAIGRRYRRQDEAGTPFGVTIDFETLGEKDQALRDTVTLRHRDSMKQERVAIKRFTRHAPAAGAVRGGESHGCSRPPRFWRRVCGESSRLGRDRALRVVIQEHLRGKQRRLPARLRDRLSESHPRADGDGNHCRAIFGGRLAVGIWGYLLYALLHGRIGCFRRSHAF